MSDSEEREERPSVKLTSQSLQLSCSISPETRMVNINQQKQPVLLGRARFETLQEDVSVESEAGLFENYEALGPQCTDQPDHEQITENKTHES